MTERFKLITCFLPSGRGAGVTTGPVTVPLVLALGLGLGKSVNAVDGFGVLAMASVGPIASVLAVGLWIRLAEAREARRAAERARLRGTAQ